MKKVFAMAMLTASAFASSVLPQASSQKLSMEELCSVKGGRIRIACNECHVHDGGVIHCTGCIAYEI